MPEKASNNWSQIIVTAVLTGVLTAVGGIVIHYVTLQKSELHYSITKTDPFYGSSAATTIYKVQIVNSGQKEIDNFRANITFPHEKIADHRTSSTGGAIIAEKLSEDTDLITSEVLNPGDRVDASYLVTFDHFAFDPEVSVRGNGITGVKTNTEGVASVDRFWIFPTIPASVALFSVLSSFVALRLRNGRFVTGATGHLSSRRDVLALGFFSVGLIHEGDRILQLRKCHYWSQSDRIAATYRESNDPVQQAKAATALEFMLAYASSRISQSSIPIVNYNIAALWLSAANESRAAARLKLAAASSSEFVWKRLEQDEQMRIFAMKNKDLLDTAWQKKLTNVTSRSWT